jgi:hypothetical protein
MNRLFKRDPFPPARPRVQSKGDYMGEVESPRRPGSMRAYALPSLQGGERVERKRPLLMA